MDLGTCKGISHDFFEVLKLSAWICLFIFITAALPVNLSYVKRRPTICFIEDSEPFGIGQLA